jgi:hypothetical protein
MSDMEVDVPPSESEYVVEGWIEQGGGARVLVSHTLPYNRTIGLADLFDLLVTDARVTLTSGDEKEDLQLVEDTMYTVLPVYRGFSIKGKSGAAYSIEVQIGDRIFTCTDTLGDPIGPDSVWFNPEPLNDSLGYVHIRLKDPPGLGNYYRIFTKRVGIDDDYRPVAGSLLDDRLFDGSAIHFPLIRKGTDTEYGDGHFFRRGQTVVVKTGVLSASYFRFLSKLSDEMGQTLSPISFQLPSITLMTGGALGGWGCYAITLDTLHIR